jgi:predicted transcriptional regulator
MDMYTERTQVLLSPEQLSRVKRLAGRERRSVGAIIREAVDAYTRPEPMDDARRAAIERLLALEAGPVDDWEVMKAQILTGSLGQYWDREHGPTEG